VQTLLERIAGAKVRKKNDICKFSGQKSAENCYLVFECNFFFEKNLQIREFFCNFACFCVRACFVRENNERALEQKR